MGKWFLTDYSATFGRILMISLADPHEIPIKWWARNFCITRIADFGQFGPVLAQISFGFCVGYFFPVWGNLSHVQGSISNARGTPEPNTHHSSPIIPITPIFGQKRAQGDPKMGQILSKDQLNLSAKY